MYFSILVLSALLASPSLAKQCTNITIPIHLTARTGNYTITEPIEPLEVTAFIQEYLRPGKNLSQELLSKSDPYNVRIFRSHITLLTFEKTQDLDYNVSATFCVPDKASFSAPPGAIQILVHGIGFDKAYVSAKLVDLRKSSIANVTSYWDLPFNNFNYSYTSKRSLWASQ